MIESTRLDLFQLIAFSINKKRYLEYYVNLWPKSLFSVSVFKTRLEAHTNFYETPF